MTATNTTPTPAKSEQRICFGIAWFTSEADADQFDLEVKRQGRTYNGGYFHGMSCGRAKEFDYNDAEMGQLYAVTQ